MAKGPGEGNEGKGKEGKGKGSGKQPAGGKAATRAALPYALKFLASEPFVAALIGKQGGVIQAIRTSCKAKLQFTEYGEVYPGTESRVLTVQAGEEEHLAEVISEVVAKLEEVAKEGSDPDHCGVDGELKIKVLVPRAAAGSIIGKAGATIKQLRESTEAKVFIQDASSSGPAADQVMLISGEDGAVKSVLVEVSSHVQALNDEGWFQGWATTAGTVSWGYSHLSGGAAAASSSTYSPGIDVMVRVAQSLPPYVIEDSRGFALSCVVPSHLVGGLIGRGGAGTREIQTLTGAKIGIREIPEDPENRSLNISGPLPAACAAYMLLMKRYLDVEQQAGTW